MASILNKNDAQNRIFSTGVEVYPLFSTADLGPIAAINDATAPSISNIKIMDNILCFNLNLEGSDFAEYDKIKIVCLDDEILSKLKRENFPQELNGFAANFIFGVERNDVLYSPRANIDNVKIDLTGKKYKQLKILVSYIDEQSGTGKSIVFPIGDDQILVNSLMSKVPSATKLFRDTTPKKDILTLLKKQTYMSDVFYSYSSDNSVSGFFVIDAEKIINDLTIFPALLSPTSNLFNEFLHCIKIHLREYGKKDFGYNFSETFGPFYANQIKNIEVKNSKGKLFYDFMARGISNLSTYELSVSLNTEDITLDLAQRELMKLMVSKSENNRSAAEKTIRKIYGNNVPSDLLYDVSVIKKLSNDDFNKLILEIQNRIIKRTQAYQKTVSNTNLSSQYMHPSPAIYETYQSQLVHKINRKIVFGQNKENTLFKLKAAFPFKVLNSQNIDTTKKVFSEITDKTFNKSLNFKTIKKFLNLSFKDQSDEVNNLEATTNCGDTDSKKDLTFSMPKPIEVKTFSESKERKIELLYLDSLGETVSSLVFKKVDEQALLSIGQSQNKVLARLVNYEEFYDSYFYITN